VNQYHIDRKINRTTRCSLSIVNFKFNWYWSYDQYDIDSQIQLLNKF